MHNIFLSVVFLLALPGSAEQNSSSFTDENNRPLNQLIKETGNAGLPAVRNPAATANETDQRFWIVVKAATKEERTKIAETGMSIEEIYPDRVAGTAHINTIKNLEELGFKIIRKTPFNEFIRDFLKDFPQQDHAYHNYGEMLKTFYGLTAFNPDLASLFSLGKSVQGRDIWALRLNTTASGTEPSKKPGAVFMGNHHAREHLSVEVPLLMAVWLCENKDEPEIKKLLDSRDIYIIPMVNPDGAEYDISDADGKYKWHRKNMRVNPDNEIGVDINRNYGYLWGGQGSTDATWSDTYRGPYAFSEPETQAIKAFIESKSNIKTLISYHSYSELILYPWGGKDEPIADEQDRKAYIAMADEMAKMTGYYPMQSCDLYIATGDATDWTYAEKGIFSFTFELTPEDYDGGGFYPGAGVIKQTAASNIKSALYLIDLADNPHRAIQ